MIGVDAGIVSAVWPNLLFDGMARLTSLFGVLEVLREDYVRTALDLSYGALDPRVSRQG